MNRHEEHDTESTELIAVPVTAIEAQTRAEVDIQISTAQKFPKHTTPQQLDRFRARAVALVTQTEDVAKSCLYSLPRQGKMITGRSVRFAELVVSAYGNIRAGSRIIEEGDTYLVAEGACHDLENNIYGSTTVRRRITDKQGRRYNEDMITMTANAACAIAYRNAVYKVIPAAICDEAYQAAREKATGGKESFVTRRAHALEVFGLMGITPERVLARLGKQAVGDMAQEDLVTLIGLHNSIKAEETSPDDAFPETKAALMVKPSDLDGGEDTNNA